ncbi:hypothetical protein [Cerasibacillus terrae]|uniref:hypothetical protein n=1 Tax=Cerasibacillus terrae TaxID=2498845 RepID=UPI001E62D8C4|nr:hypothetical protein [Cerasibacillus terrae]
MVRKGYDRFRRRKYVCQSHITEKERKRIKEQLKKQIKLMQKVPDRNELIKNVRIYNSMVIGIHNYYQIATQVNDSLMPMQYQLTQVERHRLKQFSLKKTTTYPTNDKGIKSYSCYGTKQKTKVKRFEPSLYLLGLVSIISIMQMMQECYKTM